MSELKSLNLSLSERCRALADECRSKAHSFRNEKPRTQMFQLAADYERKAKLADALEASLQKQYEVDAPLVPADAETFAEQSKKSLVGKK